MNTFTAEAQSRREGLVRRESSGGSRRPESTFPRLRVSAVRGFTLIEVLVALVVMVSAIAILAQGFTAGGGASVTAQNRTAAVWLAEAKMADLEAGILALNLGQNGTFEDRPDWSWEVASQLAATTGLYQITVTIRWKERGQDRAYHLVRLMRERPASDS